MWGDRLVLAVVPARGGSKGIPRKNLSELGGQTLVERAIRTAMRLPWVDRTVLSTDDEEIAEAGRSLGLEVPSLRPTHLGGDLTPGHEVWRHAHLEAEDRFETLFDISLLLQPTSPFRLPEDLRRCVESLTSGHADAVTTVSPTPSHFAPEKTLMLDESGFIEPYLSRDGFEPTRQRIPDYFYLNGICYAALRQAVLERAHILDETAAAVIINRPTVNIDEPFDLEMAAWLWSRMDATGGE